MKVHQHENVTGGLVWGVSSQRTDVKQLEEAKKTLEGQLEEIKLQLERDEYTSVAQMRCVFVSETFRKSCFDSFRGQYVHTVCIKLELWLSGCHCLCHMNC